MVGDENVGPAVAGGGASGHVIVAGFGLPGRSLVEILRSRNVPYVVVELNPQTVDRCAAGGTNIVQGDVAEPDVLERAGAAQASLIALMVPNDAVVLEAVSHARRLNPTAHIIARCAYTSAGLEAVRRGANSTIVAEQLVARELAEIISQSLGL